MTDNPFGDLLIPPSEPTPSPPRPEPEPGTPLAAAFAVVRNELGEEVPHEDWCCAKGCAGHALDPRGCAGGEDDCTCLQREIIQRALDAVEALERAGMLRLAPEWEYGAGVTT